MILDSQASSYCVPLLTPQFASGQSVCEAVHDMYLGESAASSQARGIQYWHHHPPAINTYKMLCQECFKYWKIFMRRVLNVILLLSIGAPVPSKARTGWN